MGTIQNMKIGALIVLCLILNQQAESKSIHKNKIIVKVPSILLTNFPYSVLNDRKFNISPRIRNPEREKEIRSRINGHVARVEDHEVRKRSPSCMYSCLKKRILHPA